MTKREVNCRRTFLQSTIHPRPKRLSTCYEHMTCPYHHTGRQDRQRLWAQILRSFGFYVWKPHCEDDFELYSCIIE